MKIIRSTKDLPKEFDIEKYEGMDKLKPYEWYYLLHNRLEIYQAIEEKNVNYIQKIFLLLENPLDIYTTFSSLDYEKNDFYNADFNHLMESKAISDFTIADFMMMEINMGTARINLGLKEHMYPVKAHSIPLMDFCLETRRKKEIFKAEQENILFDEREFLRSNGTLMRQRIPICINPFLSNQQIIDDIIPYIQNIRKNLKINKDEIIEITKYELIKWASYKILPLMDLIIWSKIHEYKITHSVLSVAVHTTGEYGEDNLRKSILPLINKLLGEDYSLLSALHSFAGHEIGKNPDSFFPEKKSLQKDRKKYIEEIVEKQMKEKDQE